MVRARGSADPDEDTDAAERYEIMDSVVIDDLDEPDDEPDLRRPSRRRARPGGGRAGGERGTGCR